MNEQIREEYERIQRLSGMDIFERRGLRGEPGGFRFICPGIALSADDVHIDRRDGKWHLSYADSVDTHEGVAEDMANAYLALIADRMGYKATFTPKPGMHEED